MLSFHHLETIQITEALFLFCNLKAINKFHQLLIFVKLNSCADSDVKKKSSNLVQY